MKTITRLTMAGEEILSKRGLLYVHVCIFSSFQDPNGCTGALPPVRIFGMHHKKNSNPQAYLINIIL